MNHMTELSHSLPLIKTSTLHFSPLSFDIQTSAMPSTSTMTIQIGDSAYTVLSWPTCDICSREGLPTGDQSLSEAPLDEGLYSNKTGGWVCTSHHWDSVESKADQRTAGEVRHIYDCNYAAADGCRTIPS